MSFFLVGIAFFFVSGMSESGLWSVVVAQKTDDDVKEGNGHFNRECYEDAIECYNKAIVSKLKAIILIKC